MLIGILGALVKELPQNLGLSTDTLELVLSTPQKHKKCNFTLKFSILIFIVSVSKTPVNMTHFC